MNAQREHDTRAMVSYGHVTPLRDCSPLACHLRCLYACAACLRRSGIFRVAASLFGDWIYKLQCFFCEIQQWSSAGFFRMLFLE